MLPSLVPGDRVVAFRWPVIRRGDMVVIDDPELPGRTLVKRVSRLGVGWLEVSGENETESRDSRSFGALPRASVLGKVVYRYHPPERSGRLR
jgi:signal peptidase I